MENIDEREIDAARFGREVQEIWLQVSGQSPETGLRLTVVLLFTELMRERTRLPWSRPDTEHAESLPNAMERAYEWFGLRDQINSNEWRHIPQSALDQLWWLVTRTDDRSVMLKCLDFLVLQLCEGIRHSNTLNRRVASFVAHFAERWSPRSGSVVDLNELTNGELGVRLNANAPLDEYLLPFRSHPHKFEVCLRLYAHDIRFRFMEDRGRSDYWDHVQFACALPRIGRSRSAPLSQDIYPWDRDGLEFATWFLLGNQGGRLAIIVLPTADLRARGRRAAARMELLKMGHVVGVVELPKRVSGTVRLSMLVASSGHRSGSTEPILLMNGRAIDGLRDEPLERLAQFLSIPFMQSMYQYDVARPYSSMTLGDALESRARKMFDSNLREMPGFFRYVEIEEIFQTEHAVLDPSQWVPEREPLVATDLLDGTPVHRLLADERQACCVYVIGNNGAGKSMLLRQLANACAASRRPVRAIASASSDRFVTKVGPDIDYIYLGARTSDTATQPRILGSKLAELIRTIHNDSAKAAAFNRVLELLSFAGRHYLLPEAANSDLLESVREFGVGPIDGSLKGWKLGFRKVDGNSIVPFDHLSTGEQQVLLLTARLVAFAKAGVVFLIDEPETSLHVAWQRSLPQVFHTISQEFTCQMVIATHSPVLVSTASGSDTFRFMAEGGVLEEIGEQAASSVERVLFQGFDTYTGNNREVHERCAELVSRAIEFANTSRGHLLPQILNELKQMDMKVAKSVPALGPGTTALHLNLIRRATIAVTELTQPAEPVGRP